MNNFETLDSVHNNNHEQTPIVHPELGSVFPSENNKKADWKEEVLEKLEVLDNLDILENLESLVNPEKQKSPDSLLNQGSLRKDGGLLLSRIALQYHRRKRA